MYLEKELGGLGDENGEPGLQGAVGTSAKK